MKNNDFYRAFNFLNSSKYKQHNSDRWTQEIADCKCFFVFKEMRDGQRVFQCSECGKEKVM